jgi:hypothetical protein
VTLLRRLAAAIFALFLSLYVLTYKGVSAGDDVFHVVAVKSWLSGRLALPDVLGEGLPRTPHAMFVAKGRDDRVYLSLPPGLALASMPFAVAGRATSGTAGTDAVIETIAGQKIEGVQIVLGPVLSDRTAR